MLYFRKILMFFAAVSFVLSLSSCDGDDGGGGYSDFQEELIDEINYARTDPSDYADNRLKSCYDAGTDNGAYTELKSTASMSALELQERLCAASQKYAEFLANNNVFGHYEKGTPSERCIAEGYSCYSGENIAAASSITHNAENDPELAAKGFVLQWIIDSGVSGVGHRKNILNSTHTHMGGGFCRDTSSIYYNYAVQDFGREN